MRRDENQNLEHRYTNELKVAMPISDSHAKATSEGVLISLSTVRFIPYSQVGLQSDRLGEHFLVRLPLVVLFQRFFCRR